MRTITYDPITTEVTINAVTKSENVGATFSSFTIVDSLVLIKGINTIENSLRIYSDSDLTISPNTVVKVMPA